MARFQDAARGSSGVPWYLDLDHEEVRLFAPMASAGPEARMLARQLREVICARHERLLARWREPGPVPFDLHRLLPIPQAILQLGEDAPLAQAWLRAHWGTSQLRGVRIRKQGTTDGCAARRRSSTISLGRLDSLASDPPSSADWPKLVLTVRPSYEDG